MDIVENHSSFIRMYVWGRPVRLFHWLNVLAIIVLSATGVIIANPPAIMSVAEPTNQYWFGVTRFIHFIAAYVFVISLLIRVYWAFAGNKYASWRVFFPYTKQGIKNLIHVIKTDILLINPEKLNYSNIAIGHNSMAAISYFVFFILMLTQIFTGFGLYSDNATWWLPKLFAWVVPFLGGDVSARMIHHLVMWGMIIFSIVHVYLVMYHDWLEGRGEVSSMFSGYKFIRKERYNDKRKEAGLPEID